MKSGFLLNLFFMLAALGIADAAGAQTSKTGGQPVEHTEGLLKTEGTYQIQVINSRNQPYIPANLDELLRKNRKAKEINYISLGTEVRLMILPFSTINDENFKPVERIAYITK